MTVSDDIKMTRSDLRGMNKDVIEVALRAVNEYGWTAKPRNSGGFSLTCPCGEHFAHIPSGTRHGHIVKSLEGNIKKCPLNKVNTAPAKRARTKMPKIADEMHLTAPIGEIIESSSGSPVIVSERPHMSKKGEKRGRTVAYESPVTIEQTWSDGVISYRCKFCDYGGRGVSNPRSIANHSGNVHKDPNNRSAQKDLVVIDEVRPPAYTKDYAPRSYNPTSRLIEALASFLAEQSWDNVDDLAVQVLTWVHDRPDLGDPEDRVRDNTPLTPEEQIARIRTIVDGGRYNELEAQIVRLQEALADAERDRDEAITRAESLHKRLEKVAEELVEGL